MLRSILSTVDLATLMPQPQIFHKVRGENVYVYSTDAVLSVLTSHRSERATADAYGAAEIIRCSSSLTGSIRRTDIPGIGIQAVQ
jgi:hypothetical protein